MQLLQQLTTPTYGYCFDGQRFDQGSARVCRGNFPLRPRGDFSATINPHGRSDLAMGWTRSTFRWLLNQSCHHSTKQKRKKLYDPLRRDKHQCHRRRTDPGAQRCRSVRFEPGSMTLIDAERAEYLTSLLAIAWSKPRFCGQHSCCLAVSVSKSAEQQGCEHWAINSISLDQLGVHFRQTLEDDLPTALPNFRHARWRPNGEYVLRKHNAQAGRY